MARPRSSRVTAVERPTTRQEAPAPASMREGVITRLGPSGTMTRSLLAGQTSVAALSGTIMDLLGRRFASEQERHSGAVYACLNKRSEAISSVPMRVYTGERDDKVEITSGPFVDLIDNPNPDLSRADYWRLVSQITDARGYCLVVKDPNVDPSSSVKIPRELWPQDPNGWEPKHEKRGNPMSRIVAWTNTATKTTYPADRVMVHRRITRLDANKGLGPMDVGSTVAESDHLAATYQRNFIGNDCNPSAWAVSTNTLTDDQFEQMQKHLRAQLQGVDNVGGIKLLENIVQFHLSTLTHRDMQFQEGREAMLEEIAMIWGVPKALLGKVADVNRATALAQKAVFWEDTVLPLLGAYADDWYRSIFIGAGQKGSWVEFDTSGVIALQEDLDSRVARFERLVKTGISVEQAARIANIPVEEFDGWDVPLVAAGLVPLAYVTAPPDDPTTEAEPAPMPEAPAEERVEAAKLAAIVSQVADGTLPPEAAKEILRLSFGLDEASIAKLIDPAAALSQDESSAEEPPTSPEETDNGEPQGEQPPGRSRMNRASLRKIIRGRARKVRAERARRNESWVRFSAKVVAIREREFAKKMRGLLGWAKGEVLRQFDAVASRAHGKRVGLTADDLAAIQINDDAWNERATAALSPTYQTTLAATARETLSEIGFDPIVFKATDPRYVGYINARLGNEIRRINDETLAQVRRTIRSGLFDGKTVTEIRSDLAGLDAFSRSRARTVAITEIGGTVNNTRAEVYDQHGIDRIVWLTSNNENVRPAHWENERAGAVNRGDPFPSGARWPHDPQAEAGDRIGCRCGIGAALEGE